MSVRWKPLILLTMLFVVLAAMGLLAITTVLLKQGAEDLVNLAQAEVKAQRYDRAVIQYERALQSDPRSAKIQLGLAETLRLWMAGDAAQVSKLRPKWLNALNQAARLAEQSAEPRRVLLADALAHEEWDDAVHWATELRTLDPSSTDAAFVLAIDGLEQRPAKVEEARSLIEELEKAEPKRERTAWTRAKLAQASNDEVGLAEILENRSGDRVETDVPDGLARLRLQAMTLERAEGINAVSIGVETLCDTAEALVAKHDAPALARQVSRLLEPAQRQLVRARRSSVDAERCVALEARLAETAARAFETSVAGGGANDPRPYQGYAEFLLIAEKRAKCLEVVQKALSQPATSAAIWQPVAMELREIGIKAALAEGDDPERFTKAAPLIAELISSSTPRFQALGHLFQGVIELEQSMARGTGGGEVIAEGDRIGMHKSALGHLKMAADGLDDVATAQALYGVALILSREPNLGRQRLQKAQLMGGDRLDPRYQVWAAWSVLQAGYPEDSAPIAGRLRAQAEAGGPGSELLATIYFLEAESLFELKQGEAARVAYEKARKAGYARSETIDLRLAQLAVQQGDAEDAMRRVEALRGVGPATAAAERLAILTLREKGQVDQARSRLAEARKANPDDTELVGLEAAMLVEGGDAAGAVSRIDAFLKTHPEEEELSLYRAKLLSGPLGRGDEARAQLSALAEASSRSAPLIQLVLLDMGRGDLEQAEASIRELRAKWSDDATADLLEAQIAVSRSDWKSASALLDSALAKDPNNKIVLYWKARLDSLMGSSREAQGILESLVRDQPTKEIDAGVTLGTAAEYALANMAMEQRDFGLAVTRFERLLRGSSEAQMQRSLQWRLAQARAAAGDTTRARSEVELLLRDPETTNDERVQAADFFRRQNDVARATREVEQILARDAKHPGAVTYRAMLYVAEQKPGAAIELVKTAMDGPDAPVGFYLLLAALENLNGETGPQAARTVLERGLDAHPADPELLRALYQVCVVCKETDPIGVVLGRINGLDTPAIREILVDAYEGEEQFDKAREFVVRDLESAGAGSSRAAALLARSIGLGLAASRRELVTEVRETRLRRLGEEIVDAQKQYPQDSRFVSFEAEQALAVGDLARATQVADELAEMDKNSPEGPLLQARVAAERREPEAVARAYERAVERSPARVDLRLMLGQVKLSGGRYDEAIELASTVLEGNPEVLGAKLLKAQALALRSSSDAAASGSRAEAIAILDGLIATTPQFAEPYHLLSDLQLASGDRTKAIATLKLALERMPADDEALGLFVQRLAEPTAENQPASTAMLAQAEERARAACGDDPDGRRSLAVALGYHRAGRSDLALRWAEQAAARSDTIAAQLALGDVLLAGSDREGSGPGSTEQFERAVEAYNRVLRLDPLSVEAANNKAWILHRYLGRNEEALAVVEPLVRQKSAAELPADFHDTVGAIQLALGQNSAAEASFQNGLTQAPDHPILNFHLARLLAGRPDRTSLAKEHLARASRNRDILPSDLAAEMDRLAATLDAAE